MLYRLQLVTAAGDLPWCHDVNLHSDRIAHEYAERILTHDTFAKAAFGIVVFNITNDTCIANLRAHTTITVSNLVSPSTATERST